MLLPQLLNNVLNCFLILYLSLIFILFLFLVVMAMVATRFVLSKVSVQLTHAQLYVCHYYQKSVYAQWVVRVSICQSSWPSMEGSGRTSRGCRCVWGVRCHLATSIVLYHIIHSYITFFNRLFTSKCNIFHVNMQHFLC